jgi:TPR repeat protein
MQNFVRPAVLLFSLLLSSCSSSNEGCSPEKIGLTESSNIAETLFYTGTCHYRNEEYAQSVEYWTTLSQLENIAPEYQALQISSLNNLGYMKFYGFGTAEDKDLAIDYWQAAALVITMAVFAIAPVITQQP